MLVLVRHKGGSEAHSGLRSAVQRDPGILTVFFRLRGPTRGGCRFTAVGIGERDSRRAWGQQLVVRGQLHSPMGKLVMRVAHVAPIRARCFNSKRTSFHVALELEHVESVMRYLTIQLDFPEG